MMQLQALLQSLSTYFLQARLAGERPALMGLYPQWWRYSGLVASLLSCLLRCLVTKLAPNLQDMNPSQGQPDPRRPSCDFSVLSFPRLTHACLPSC